MKKIFLRIVLFATVRPFAHSGIVNGRRTVRHGPSTALSRFQRWAIVCLGGLVLLLGAALDILGHFQALDYLQLHWNPAYLFLASEKTHIVLILVGFGMLGFAIWKLTEEPDIPGQATPIHLASSQRQDVPVSSGAEPRSQPETKPLARDHQKKPRRRQAKKTK